MNFILKRNIFRLLMFAMFFGSLSPIIAAERVYIEDFEDQNELDSLGTDFQEYYDTLTGSTNIVNIDCHDSTYCFRGNNGNTGIPDAITGEPGTVNPHTVWGGGDMVHGSTNNFDLADIDTGEVYISWWHKFDKDIGDALPSGRIHKVFYARYTPVWDDNLIIYLNGGGSLRMVVSGDGQSGFPYTAGDADYGCANYTSENDCTDESINSNYRRCIWRDINVVTIPGCYEEYQYGFHISDRDEIYIDDGSWHHFSFWTNYGTGGTQDGQIKLWIDNELVLDIDNAWIISETGNKFDFFALPSNWNAYSYTMDSFGWQIDDVEIWNAVPGVVTCSDYNNDQITCEENTCNYCNEACQSESCEEAAEIRADVNQDLQINTTDAMLTLRNSLGLDMTETVWIATDTTGDVNCDGNSNSTDAMLLLRYSLGLDMSGTDWCE